MPSARPGVELTGVDFAISSAVICSMARESLGRQAKRPCQTRGGSDIIEAPGRFGKSILGDATAALSFLEWHRPIPGRCEVEAPPANWRLRGRTRAVACSHLRKQGSRRRPGRQGRRPWKAFPGRPGEYQFEAPVRWDPTRFGGNGRNRCFVDARRDTGLEKKCSVGWKSIWKL